MIDPVPSSVKNTVEDDDEGIWMRLLVKPPWLAKSVSASLTLLTSAVTACAVEVADEISTILVAVWSWMVTLASLSAPAVKAVEVVVTDEQEQAAAPRQGRRSALMQRQQTKAIRRQHGRAKWCLADHAADHNA